MSPQTQFKNPWVCARLARWTPAFVDTRRYSPVVLLLVVVLASSIGLIAGISTVLAESLIGVAGALAVAVVFWRQPFKSLIAVWVFEIFQLRLVDAAGASSSIGTLLNYSDDASLVLLSMVSLLRVVSGHARLSKAKLLVPAFCFAAIGLLSGIVVHERLTVLLLGTYMANKLFLSIFVALSSPIPEKPFRSLSDAILTVGTIVALIGVAEVLFPNQLRALWNSDEPIQYRFGFASMQSVFPHPGRMARFMAICFSVAICRYAAVGKPRDLVRLLLFALCAILTFRLKAILDLAAVSILAVLVLRGVERRRLFAPFVIGTVALLLFGSVVFSVLSVQLTQYTTDVGTTARGELYSTGVQVADRYFPAGAGFGRYGGYTARLFYSGLYYQYGFASQWGLSPTYGDFLTDTSWPAVIGEAGYLGALCYGLTVLTLIKELAKFAFKSRQAEARLSALTALSTLAIVLVESTGDATLFLSDVGMIVALTTVVAIAEARSERNTLVAGTGVDRSQKINLVQQPTHQATGAQLCGMQKTYDAQR